MKGGMNMQNVAVVTLPEANQGRGRIRVFANTGSAQAYLDGRKVNGRSGGYIDLTNVETVTPETAKAQGGYY